MRPVFWCKRWVEWETKKIVSSGLFCGLNYVSIATGSVYYPKLLGSYEIEIQQALGTVISQNPGSILILGAGEGYYAAGLAKLLPASKVLAFESDPNGQALMQQLVNLNQLENMTIEGEFRIEKHRNLLEKNELIMVDIEGGESMLNGIGLFEDSKSNWIIEIHHPVILAKMIQEVELKFDYEWIPIATRTLKEYPENFHLLLPKIFGRYWLSLLQEWRGESLGWMILQRKPGIK